MCLSKRIKNDLPSFKEEWHKRAVNTSWGPIHRALGAKLSPPPVGGVQHQVGSVLGVAMFSQGGLCDVREATRPHAV